MGSLFSSTNFYILLSLSDGKLHGYDIMKRVYEDSEHTITLGPGTLYGSIKRLLEMKLINEVRSPKAINLISADGVITG